MDEIKTHITVQHPRKKEAHTINLKTIVERSDVKNCNELARFICDRFDWDIENPRMQRVHDKVVCNEWDDLKGHYDYEIAALAGNV